MKKLFGILITCLILASCDVNPNQQYSQDSSNVNVTVVQKPAGLDLQALGELAKTTKDAGDFETKLNQTGGINNVDLDEDGNVDYLYVTEFGSNNDRGFSVEDYVKNSSTGNVDTNEIANITFSKNVNTNQVTTNINGNTNIYGNNNSYQTSSLLTDMILFNYLFSPHRYYYSPYHYGYYPSYYHSYRSVSPTVYSSTVTKTTTKSVFKPTTKETTTRIKSPYSNKTSPNITREFSAPKSSAKSFSVRETSKPVDNSGFRNKTTSSSSSSSFFKSKSTPSTYKSSPSKSSGFRSTSSRRR